MRYRIAVQRVKMRSWLCIHDITVNKHSNERRESYFLTLQITRLASLLCWLNPDFTQRHFAFPFCIRIFLQFTMKQSTTELKEKNKLHFQGSLRHEHNPQTLTRNPLAHTCICTSIYLCFIIPITNDRVKIFDLYFGKINFNKMDKHNFFEDKKQKNNLKNYLIIQPKLFVRCIYLWKFINNSLMIFFTDFKKTYIAKFLRERNTSTSA